MASCIPEATRHLKLFSQMLPGRRNRDPVLTVEQKHGSLFARQTGRSESIVGKLTPSARYDPRHSPLETRAFQKGSETLSASRSQTVRITASFNIQPDRAFPRPAHHRLPPISPLTHRLPRLYFSNQGRRRSLSSRWIDVPLSSFSQTRTTSGISVKASTRPME